jgi:hypothetical protein
MRNKWLLFMGMYLAAGPLLAQEETRVVYIKTKTIFTSWPERVPYTLDRGDSVQVLNYNDRSNPRISARYKGKAGSVDLSVLTGNPCPEPRRNFAAAPRKMTIDNFRMLYQLDRDALLHWLEQCYGAVRQIDVTKEEKLRISTYHYSINKPWWSPKAEAWLELVMSLDELGGEDHVLGYSFQFHDKDLYDQACRDAAKDLAVCTLAQQGDREIFEMPGDGYILSLINTRKETMARNRYYEFRFRFTPYYP